MVELRLKRNQECRLETAFRPLNATWEMTRTCDNGAVCQSDLSRSDIPL
jgi:hypothetical protein